MQKKFVLVFILVSAKCFTGELEKYQGATAQVLPEFNEGMSILERLSLGESNKDEKLQTLRKFLPEKVIFRDASFLYDLDDRDYDRLSLQEYDNMRDLGQQLWQEAASSSGDSNALSRMQLLIKSFACVNCSHCNRINTLPRGCFLTPLECAVLNENIACCRLLAQTNAKVRIEHLVSRDNVEILRMFVDEPYLNKYKITKKAMIDSKKRVLDFMLKSYVENFTSTQIDKLLEKYSHSKNIELDLLDFLLKKACVNKLQSPLLANAVHDAKALRLIFEYTKVGLNEALKKSVVGHHLNSVNFLLENGGDANLVIDTSTNENLLMRAAKDGCEGLAKALLNHGAIKDVTNSQGLNAAAIAMVNKHKNIANIILGGRTCCDKANDCFVSSANGCDKCGQCCCGRNYMDCRECCGCHLL